MKTKDDDKLDEVKAILRRLQRIGAGDEEGAAPAAAERAIPSQEGSGREWPHHKIMAPPTRVKNAPPAPQEASVTEMAAKRWSTSLLGKIAFAAVPALLLVAGLSFAFWPESGQKPQPTSPPNKRAGAEPPASPPPPSDQNAGRVSYAQRLIDEGKIVAGRNLLLDGLAERRADAALVLARSYDPNSLRLIPNADAPPDIEEAERWYRRWHEIAASDGLALDAHRLDRIIKAMR